ncbi:hypothetical protein [Alicyclobacillus sp. SP_1]|uniref:hypothetical protein n=1 Tax=Alicyclobacillus sp. SP_1 TaxID=2942475 RepID=UPI0021571A40|nr:hypothetical protein [Alicyclobacillus sp. SP_1]
MNEKEDTDMYQDTQNAENQVDVNVERPLPKTEDGDASKAMIRFGVVFVIVVGVILLVLGILNV